MIRSLSDPRPTHRTTVLGALAGRKSLRGMDGDRTAFHEGVTPFASTTRAWCALPALASKLTFEITYSPVTRNSSERLPLRLCRVKSNIKVSPIRRG
jgi:hypothetical protein